MLLRVGAVRLKINGLCARDLAPGPGRGRDANEPLSLLHRIVVSFETKTDEDSSRNCARLQIFSLKINCWPPSRPNTIPLCNLRYVLCLCNVLTNVFFLLQRVACLAATRSTATASSLTNACEYPLYTFVLNA